MLGGALGAAEFERKGMAQDGGQGREGKEGGREGKEGGKGREGKEGGRELKCHNRTK